MPPFAFSIKDVLPTLVPELSYKDLSIGDGGVSGDVCGEGFSAGGGDSEGFVGVL